MRSHRLAGLCLVFVALLALDSSSALAVQTHPYTGVSFGPDGVGGSQSFQSLRSVAIDPATGDLYAYDAAAEKIYKYDEDGNPVNFSALGGNSIGGIGGGGGGPEFGVAIAPPGSPGGTAGDIYVANNENKILVYAPGGTKLGAGIDQGVETCGVATDPSGNFYASGFPSTVNRYTPAANPPTSANKTSATVEQNICNVAADGLGNVYAANYNGGLFKLEGMADTTPVEVDPQAKTMAIAPGSNDLYADRESEVAQYDSDGNLLGSFGAGEISESRGIAVNPGASKIYVNTPAKVKVFGALTTVPDATTGGATEITKGRVTLNGSVSAAGGPAATCVFQYATSQQYFEHGFDGAGSAPCAPAGPFEGNSTTAVSATITGLASETFYYFRLRASSANGLNPGAALNFSTPPAVNLTTGAATNVTKGTATLNGTINPEETSIEECRFEYGRDGSYGSSVPCAETPAEIGAGNAPISVHADVSGLEPSSEYHFRLAAKNEFGSDRAADVTFETLAPRIEEVSVIGVTETEATLKATINPNGEETTYSFEYVSEADFASSGYDNATRVPSGGEAIGSGTIGVEVEAALSGLTPRTTYHARVVATNSGGAAVGSDLLLTTFSPTATGLPDDRAYEQATPVDKDGNNAQGYVNQVRTSPAGNGIKFFVNGGLPGGEGAQDFTSFLSLRGTASWSTQGLQPPARLAPVGFVLGASRGLGTTYTKAFSPAGAGLGKQGFYERNTATGQITPIYSFESDHFSDNNPPGYVGSSADDSEALLKIAAPLLPGAAAGTEERGVEAINLYLWDRASQRLVLASVLNDGQAPSEAGVFPGPYNWIGTGGGNTIFYLQEENVLSPDGSRVVFTGADDHQLYARVNPLQPQSAMNGEECTEAAMACTIEVSRSVRTTPDPLGPQPAKFLTVTPDGSKILFMSRAELTDDANTGGDQSEDLYSYDTATGDLTDLSSSMVGDNPEGVDVAGVLGTSSDGSYVYFAAGGVLAPGASAGTCPQYEVQVSGADDVCNIYLWHAGSISFIAHLAIPDSEPFKREWLVRNWAAAETGPSKLPHSGYVSPDGRTLVFGSRNNLTSYDSSGFLEFYRHSAGQDGFTCLTCPPSGETPAGDAGLASIFPGAIKAGNSNVSNPHNLADDGNRFFFESVDKLVSTDTNGVRDVYEWEADGSGSCTSQDQNGGCLYLISSGTSPIPSFFADAGESGGDAYFFTAQPLVGQDRDELVDIYDARIGGGIASQNPPGQSICTGESCRPQVTPPPAEQSAGTSAFSEPAHPKTAKKHKKKHHKKRHSRGRHHTHRGKGAKQGGSR